MPSYINKTIHYLKRNGVKNTYYAVMERLTPGGMADYRDYKYVCPNEDVLKLQHLMWEKEEHPVTFSLLVPAYETKAEYLTALIDSVLAQTWESWQLIIADASASAMVERIVALYEDSRICYHKIGENKGISENTNEALALAKGDYVGLLDHDDLLTPDALYEMAKVILERTPIMLYSDEDKCDGTGKVFYEPHYKLDFNYDLLLTNNYICHFTVISRNLICALKLRDAFNGAQDYDLVLRVVREILKDDLILEEQIIHIPKILYHWRCHALSTADNPQSKLYAYEAGRRALEDYFEQLDIRAKVQNTTHLGFYQVEYSDSFWSIRTDIGALGGKITGVLNKITSGILDKNGNCIYSGLDVHYSGYMHRADLPQNVEAVDIRCMKLRMECKELFEEYFACKIPMSSCFDGFFSTEKFWMHVMRLQNLEEEEYRRISVDFCRCIREKGYRIGFDPKWVVRL